MSKPLVSLVALALALCLVSGCSGQTADSAETSTDTAQETTVEQSETVTEGQTPTGFQVSTPAADEHTEAIAKSWAPVAVLYEGEVYPFSEYETFEGLYSSTYVTLYDNGRFAYQSKIYIYRGTWTYHDDYDGVLTYVLTTDSVAKLTLESGVGGEVVNSEGGKVFIAYLVGDQPFLVLTEQGDDINETPLPAFVASDEWEVPMEASKGASTTSTSAPSATSTTSNSTSAPTQQTTSGNTSTTHSPTSNATSGEQRAAERARSYLGTMAFSREGLIDQLEYEGFSHSEAVYGADNAGADWSEQAALKAREYLRTMPFSRAGLIDQLEYEGFTTDQAEYGVSVCGADWNEQAVKKARQYLDLMPFSYDELVDQLEYEGFTHSEAVYGASNA